MIEIRYDRCPECGGQVPSADGLNNDTSVECPSCPWKGTEDELTSGIVFPYAPQNCPGFDPGNVLAAYGGRRCQNCGMREPNGTETHPAPRHGIVQLQRHLHERSGPGGGLFELPAYPKLMLEKFAAIQRTLPVGTVLDWFGSGPENYTVITGYELLPVVQDSYPSQPCNTEGAYLVLHMSRADGFTRFGGAKVSFEEAATYAEKRVGMLSELATAEGEL